MCPDGYGYTQFNKYVSEYREKNDYSYHNVHEPGREWQIDFAGDALYLTDPHTNRTRRVVVEKEEVGSHVPSFGSAEASTLNNAKDDMP